MIMRYLFIRDGKRVIKMTVRQIKESKKLPFAVTCSHRLHFGAFLILNELNFPTKKKADIFFLRYASAFLKVDP
jgi:hypothetical protein